MLTLTVILNQGGEIFRERLQLAAMTAPAVRRPVRQTVGQLVARGLADRQSVR